MQPRTHCELLKVIATEAEKLLLDGPLPELLIFLAKNAQCGRGEEGRGEEDRTAQVFKLEFPGNL